jgi:hypothetical protein
MVREMKAPQRPPSQHKVVENFARRNTKVLNGRGSSCREWRGLPAVDWTVRIWSGQSGPSLLKRGLITYIQGWTGGGRGSQFHFDHAPPSTPARNTRPVCDYCSHQHQLVLYTYCTHPAHPSFFGSQIGRDNPLTLSAYVCAPFN